MSAESRIFHPEPVAKIDPNGCAQTPAEFAEFVELARRAFSANSAISTNSTARGEQPAIYPSDSLFAVWMDFARTQEESADAFLLGSILPVVAALLGRRVWFQLEKQGESRLIQARTDGKPEIYAFKSEY